MALALVDHIWMPRPQELFETADPLTAGFAFVRWIGDRKGIEEQTKVWNRTLIDRSGELREWVKILTGVARRVDIMFAYANNHYGGFAPDTIELFRSLWPLGEVALQGNSVKPQASAGPPGQQLLGFGKDPEPDR